MIPLRSIPEELPLWNFQSPLPHFKMVSKTQYFTYSSFGNPSQQFPKLRNYYRTSKARIIPSSSKTPILRVPYSSEAFGNTISNQFFQSLSIRNFQTLLPKQAPFQILFPLEMPYFHYQSPLETKIAYGNHYFCFGNPLELRIHSSLELPTPHFTPKSYNNYKIDYISQIPF